jgi:hypothetical protein
VEDRERRPVAGADEQTEEGSAEDVELHRRRPVQANTEAPAEGESDDDVELHRKQSMA